MSSSLSVKIGVFIIDSVDCNPGGCFNLTSQCVPHHVVIFLSIHRHIFRLYFLIYLLNIIYYSTFQSYLSMLFTLWTLEDVGKVGLLIYHAHSFCDQRFKSIEAPLYTEISPSIPISDIIKTRSEIITWQSLFNGFIKQKNT